MLAAELMWTVDTLTDLAQDGSSSRLSIDTRQRNKRSSAEPEDSGDKTFTNDLGVICLFSHSSRPRSRTTRFDSTNANGMFISSREIAEVDGYCLLVVMASSNSIGSGKNERNFLGMELEFTK
ncbi:hypothetical protein CEXT_125221 [Caerostris extrusa]|uniref:Uncharacterized protein n=1 Tax=Caerostris extrusa TaxID=172846 RepID=A0AAV4MVB1_CAEEX|nr:hypothetical protein CEXT_125221 [Caerostris extrusa]